MKLSLRSPRGARCAPVRALPFAFAGALLFVSACVNVNPPTDVGNPVSPSSSSSAPTPTPTPTPTPSGQALAYIPDLKPIFDSDCVPCHNSSFAAAGYSMATYADIMRAVQPGNANSPLVSWSVGGGPMYRYWTGNAAQKASMLQQWVVTYNAQQTR